MTTAAIVIGVITVVLAGVTALRNGLDLGDRWRGFRTKRMGQRDLRLYAEETNRKLVDLIESNASDEDQAFYKPFTVNNFNQRASEVTNYSLRLQNAYHKDIGPNVESVRVELAKHGIQDDDLDKHFEHTVGSIGLRVTSRALIRVAAKLER